MYRIFVILLIVVVIGSYLLPSGAIQQVPFGQNIQQITKQAISWSITKIDELTEGALTNTFEGLKERAKDEIKDAAKEQVDKNVDKILP